jgi:hypothetical protein
MTAFGGGFKRWMELWLKIQAADHIKVTNL